MAGLRDVLQRFRPVAVPGAPTGGAVPADRASEQAAELAPVFALLDETEAEARAIRVRGDAEAAEIRQEAARRAEAILRDARTRAAQERQHAASQARSQAEIDCAALVHLAQTRAQSLTARAEPRVREYAEQIVAQTAAQLVSPRPHPARGPSEPGAPP